MQRKSRQAALRIREAFLALPDELLLAKVLGWAEDLDPDNEGWDTMPEYLMLMGLSGAVAHHRDDLRQPRRPL